MKLSQIACLVGVMSLVACTAMTGDPGSEDDVDDESGETDDVGEETEASASAVTTKGDWSKFGNGQCLVAIQKFYPAKFGASVPVARGSWTGGCAPYGACHIWLDDRPSTAKWQRIANKNGAKPKTYDMIVYPPTANNPYGHIASVDHVDSNGRIFVMDSNYNYDEKKASKPHTVGWKAYGWYRLKK